METLDTDSHNIELVYGADKIAIEPSVFRAIISDTVQDTIAYCAEVMIEEKKYITREDAYEMIGRRLYDRSVLSGDINPEKGPAKNSPLKILFSEVKQIKKRQKKK